MLPVRIISKQDHFVALANKVTVEWYKGTHTANVYDGRGCIDVFTFAWEKNNASLIDFTTSLQTYLEYLDSTYSVYD